jgi:hypothetical protein
VSAIEWTLLEFFLATDPASRLSAMVVVSTVLVAFALAAVVIAGAARAAVRAAVEPAPAARPSVRIQPRPLAPRGTGTGAPLTGRPAPRAPDAFLRRSLRTA